LKREEEEKMKHREEKKVANNNNLGKTIFESIVPATPKLKVINICETITKEYADIIVGELMLPQTSLLNVCVKCRREDGCNQNYFNNEDYKDEKNSDEHSFSHDISPSFSHDISPSFSHDISPSFSHDISPLCLRPGGYGGAQRPHILLNIHCNGGSIHETFRIIDAIRSAKRYTIVITVINSIAFSTAAMIFASGSNGYRFVSPNAQMMIHQPRVIDHHLSNYNDNSREKRRIKISTKHLNDTQEQIIDIIVGALENEPREVIESFLENVEKNKHCEWFLKAKEMIAYGLANHIGVPDVVHQFEYRPLLVLDNGIIKPLF
jgi:ATP-dependent protease ClpP protease subunit